jgi:glucokinase
MAHSALEAIRKIGLAPSDVTRVGLGSPGTHDIPTGFLIVPPNLPGWDHFPIRDRVSAHCGLPVTFSNDANAAAYGEFWVGSGRGAESMVMFTLGTGVGCGIIIGDLIVEGQNSHGGECGHIIIDHGPAARRCSCGQLGHLEAYASATALIKRTEEALQGGRKSSIVARLEHGGSVTPLLLAEEAEGGDRLALELVLETARLVGVGAVNLMHTIDPEMVLIGGAMTFGGHDSELGRRFLEEIRSEVRRRAFPVLAERVRIDFASLGGDAGTVGAAGVARLAHLNKHVA